MSVAETVGTPMSVDKTSLDDDQKALAIKNDRERFFEVAEYQKDILKYLKTTEVKNFYIIYALTCSALRYCIFFSPIFNTHIHA